MTSSRLKNELWEGLWEAERLYRYYAYLASRYERLGTGAAIVTVVLIVAAGSVTVASALLNENPDSSLLVAGRFIGAGIALGSFLVTLTLGYQSKTVQADLASKRYYRVAATWQKMWMRGDSDDDSTLRYEIERLKMEQHFVDADVALPAINEKAIDRADRETKDYLDSLVFTSPVSGAEMEAR